MLAFSLIFLQIVIFAGMIFILKKIMSTNVTMATKHIEEMSQEYLKKEEEVSRRLEEAKRTSEDMVSKAIQEADTVKTRKLNEAENESIRIIEEARTKSEEIMQLADKSRERLLGELDDRIAIAAIDKSVELIHDILPEKFVKDVHAHWVVDLMDHAFAGIEKLNIPKDLKEIRVVSAFELTPDQRGMLLKKLKDSLSYDSPVKEETDPRLVAGLVLHFGSLVLDGSLRSRIRERAKDAKHAGS